MKRLAILALPLTLLAAAAADAYPLVFAEDFYELYHRHLVQSTDDVMENIGWLERALKSDFRNPLYALARIETESQWARYQALFYMHVNLEMVKLYRTFGALFQKQNAFFYNYPWKRQNLESLDTAEQIYRQAYYYWDQAVGYALEAWSLRAERLPEIQAWMTENYRIMTEDLNYKRILDSDMRKIQRVREQFLAMGPDTY